VHGVGRVGSGFNLVEVASEYRALRASVLRLWRESNPAPELHVLNDITRFYGSIDQSLAKAVAAIDAATRAGSSLPRESTPRGLSAERVRARRARAERSARP
jgi:hypothetical protein